jgi:flagellar basal-body rod protein FlgC
MAGLDLQRVFDIAGTALNAQSVRMNTIASNLANVGSEASSEAEAFRAKRTVFEALLRKEQLHQGAPVVGGVKLAGIVDDPAPVISRFDPRNPKANEKGYVYLSNVNAVAEMVDMLDASRGFENNVEVVNTARQLMLKTLEVIRS